MTGHANSRHPGESRDLRRQKRQHPTTPDGRYFVVRGRLWRTTNPALPQATREALIHELMSARRAVRDRKPDARARVDAAKRALGERGPPWWTDGAPDWNRHLAKNTPYADWYAALDSAPDKP